MRTMFAIVPFGREASPLRPLLMSPRMSGVVLGQDIEDLSFLSDSITGLLREVPTDLLGKYDAEYNRCLSIMEAGIIGIPAGTRCLRDLYFELKDVVKGRVPTPTTPATTPRVPARPAPAPFPVVPVVIAVGAAGVLIYFLTRERS